MDPIETMKSFCIQLIDSLEKNEDETKVKEKLALFRQSVQDSMSLFKKGKIEVTIKSLPYTMYDFVINELPQLVSGAHADKAKAVKYLNLFLNTINLVLEPQVR